MVAAFTGIEPLSIKDLESRLLVLSSNTLVLRDSPIEF
jgi:hypothetical protein